VLSGTNRLDMLKIHDVKSMEDVYQMSQKGHLIDIFLRMKEEKVTCFIGFSGHGNADALKEMASRAKFDSMLIAMNHWNANQHFKKEEEVLPGGKKKKMGILLMKAVPPKELKVIVIHGAMTFFPGE
jgi:predicted aldo/keto reductase-like oxidoreductase